MKAHDKIDPGKAAPTTVRGTKKRGQLATEDFAVNPPSLPRGAIATPPNYFDEFMEYEGRRLQAEDRDIQEDACRDYFQRTSPSKWSFDGWLEYWDLHRPAPVISSDFLNETLYVDESRYLEIEKWAQRLYGDGTEEEKTEDRPRPKIKKRREVATATEEERAAFRAKVRHSRWYSECGAIAGEFIWIGKIYELAVALSEETNLLPFYIRHKDGVEVYRASLADGLFCDKHGKVITHQQLYDGAKSQDIKFEPPTKE